MTRQIDNTIQPSRIPELVVIRTPNPADLPIAPPEGSQNRAILKTFRTQKNKNMSVLSAYAQINSKIPTEIPKKQNTLRKQESINSRQSIQTARTNFWRNALHLPEKPL
ncbi:MAG: hypothetical protein Q4D98_00975 [Planctomycetia bacterium]|nr:hypothetical protein [Planctomycetia bacterium]